MAAFVACSVLSQLGYFIGLSKSSLQPQKAVRFLGYVCDSDRQAFVLPDDKRQKFALLRKEILGTKTVSLKKQQKFAGKTTSFSLSVPATKVFTNRCYQAIGRAQRASSTQIWGGTLERQGYPRHESRGYCDDEHRHLPIAVREARALILLTMEYLLTDTNNARVDAFVDNQAVLHSWERQTSRSPRITCVMKDMFSFCSAHNISMSVFFVPSKQNIADRPSRTVSDLDAKHSVEC